MGEKNQDKSLLVLLVGVAGPCALCTLGLELREALAGSETTTAVTAPGDSLQSGQRVTTSLALEQRAYNTALEHVFI